MTHSTGERKVYSVLDIATTKKMSFIISQSLIKVRQYLNDSGKAVFY